MIVNVCAKCNWMYTVDRTGCPECDAWECSSKNVPVDTLEKQSVGWANTMVAEEVTPLDKQEGGSHYKLHAIQPAVYCQENGLHYCEANVVKYVTRHRDKGGKEDILKAIHYLEMLLEMEYEDE